MVGYISYKLYCTKLYLTIFIAVYHSCPVLTHAEIQFLNQSALSNPSMIAWSHERVVSGCDPGCSCGRRKWELYAGQRSRNNSWGGSSNLDSKFLIPNHCGSKLHTLQTYLGHDMHYIADGITWEICESRELVMRRHQQPKPLRSCSPSSRQAIASDGKSKRLKPSPS